MKWERASSACLRLNSKSVEVISCLCAFIKRVPAGEEPSHRSPGGRVLTRRDSDLHDLHGDLHGDDIQLLRNSAASTASSAAKPSGPPALVSSKSSNAADVGNASEMGQKALARFGHLSRPDLSYTDKKIWRLPRLLVLLAVRIENLIEMPCRSRP